MIFISLNIITDSTNAQVSVIGCATDCLTCFGTGANECMSCTNGKYLLKYQCITNCATSIPTAIGYTGDSNDMVCKRTAGPFDNPCPVGTFNQNAGSQILSQCSDCTAGKFCESFGRDSVQSDCDAGFYCKAKSYMRSPLVSLYTVATDNIGDICPIGSYCSSGVTEPTMCTPGYYCPNEMMDAYLTSLPCNKGYYCDGGAESPSPNGPFPGIAQIGGDVCPKGKYCVTATAVPGDCPTGSYLPYKGAWAQDECLTCTPGKYCPDPAMETPAGDCTAGYYCGAGQISATALRCYQDMYCPLGSKTMISCAIGSYTAGTGAATCMVCPAGYYCRGTNTENKCPNGMYCLGDIKYPCPAGTYMLPSTTGASTIASCLACPQGFGCNSYKFPYPLSFACSAGFYCDGQSTTTRPNNAAQHGAMCKPGTYCLAGQSAKTDCPIGNYCPNYASNLIVQCPAGYYCPSTGTSDSSDTTKFKICDPGYYCPIGSYAKIPCEAGYYSQSQGATAQSDCDKCPSGWWCPGLNLAIPPSNIGTSGCVAGSYCPAGSTTSTATTCSRGFYCPAGTETQLLCPLGQYQPLSGQASCKLCDAGYYCDGTDTTTYQACPRGYYCPPGTIFGTQFACPAGTYGTQTKRTQLSDCIYCDAGYYCQFPGQTAQTMKTLSRYHQNGEIGQTIPNPYLCPQTMYCPEGTFMAFSCPDGYWTTTKGASSENDCITCPRGSWCKYQTMSNQPEFKSWMETNPSWDLAKLQAIENNPLHPDYTWRFLTTYSGNCNPGYICLEGAMSPTPIDKAIDHGYMCPIGYMCQPGDKVETPCLPGTWNELVMQAFCKPCVQGFYCPDFAMNKGDSIPCLKGYYCPGGDIYPKPCPIGTYGSPAGAISSTQCLACDAGSFCDTVGAVQPTDFCAPGFICGTGNSRPGPYVTTYSSTLVLSGKCPLGYICALGDLTPSLCPSQTYQPATQTQKCENCPPGSFCTGGTDINSCKAGYYCSKRSLTDAPTVLQAEMGGICPMQHFCPEGTSQPLICPDGQIQRKIGMSSCNTCPPGFTCKAGVQTTCPMYKVCMSNETDIYPYGSTCRGGFYLEADRTGVKNYANCTACPSAKFCQASRIVNSCAPGYVCIAEADSHRPSSKDKAYPCPVGYWCGEGAQQPIMCPVGTFTNDTAAKQVSECTMCQPGKYCDYENRIPQACPTGAFCPINSQAPQFCPKGTFQPHMNASGIDDCIPCLGGYYCNVSALGNILAFGNKFLCPNGNYCPTGSNIKPIPCLAGTFIDQGAVDSNPSATDFKADSINDCNFCPEHYYCERGTGYRYKYPCKDGNLCPKGSGDMVPCPPGFYCKRFNNTMVQKICPVGSFCPMGSATPKNCEPDQICPIGSPSPASGGLTNKDCKEGTYLSINVCKPCMPGFVCDKWTNQKYPVYLNPEGGAECPPGYYCPGGSTTKTAIKCPIGTQRYNTGGKRISDCIQCPSGSSAGKLASKICIVCGSGSTNSEDFSTCQCIGAFRSWQETTNSCVCLPGFQNPVVTVATTSDPSNLDCIPILTPTCDMNSNFINEFNECVSRKTWCNSYYKCPGQSSFDSTLNNCFCNDDAVPPNPASYCDQTCIDQALKAYFNQDGTITLKAGSLQKVYAQSAFGSSTSFAGLACETNSCPITAMTTNSLGQQQASAEALPVFVKVWVQDFPQYKSPYSNSSRLLNLTNGRDLQDSVTSKGFLPRKVTQSIQCIKIWDAVSWATDPTSFPVYVKDSQFNTDPNFDYGAFVTLGTQLTSTELQIDSFGFTFSKLGQFVFGNNIAPDRYQTIVKVVKKEDWETECYGKITWPITAENMKKLKILPILPILKSYEDGLHVIPPLFIMCAFVIICCQQCIEYRIESRELALRIQHEGHSIDMTNYFKKPQDKFDKLEYLADLYKLIRENLDEINSQIAENDRRTVEENRDNMNKMLFDKYSLLRELHRGKGDVNLEDIRTGLLTMLSNLRFADGRSLEELYKEQVTQNRLAQEKAHLEQIQAQVQQNSDDEKQEEEDNKDNQILIQAETKEQKDDQNESDLGKQDKEDQVSEELTNNISDPALFDDLMKARQQLKQKREHFIQSIDKSISEDDRQLIMQRYDDQMQRLERELLKEQEDQANALKAKLQLRKGLHKQVNEIANEEVAQNVGLIADLEKKIEQIELEKDDIEETGINSKAMKKEREQELKQRVTEIERDKDNRMVQMRQEYMDRIKKAKDGQEKERILAEMGERLKSTEQALNDDQKRQEANLMKLLKARQKKNLKQTVKKMNKEVEQYYDQIDGLKVKVDENKAEIYADQGVQGQTSLVSSDVNKLVQKIISTATTEAGENILFNGELTEQEKDDMDIERAQLEFTKLKELKAIDVQVEEELDSQFRAHRLEREHQKVRIQQLITQTNQQQEKQKLIEELQEVDIQMKREIEEEKRSQNVILEERRRRKTDRMAIRKMRIENDQLEDILNKELQMNNNKFKAQVDTMTETANNLLTKEIKQFLTSDCKNKEKALVMISETQDEILKRVQKMVQSKQFFDFAKHLQCLQQQCAMDQMIRTKEINSRFDILKESAIHDMQGEKLSDELSKLQAQRILECQLLNEAITRSISEKESLLRQKQEVIFYKERKEIITHYNSIKRAQISSLMAKYPNEKSIQNIGGKLIKRIDNTQDEEIAQLEREKEEKVEKAKLRMIAENEEELQILQDNLNQAMMKEEGIMNEQLDSRKAEIMKIKKQNLEDRLRMATGEMTQEQMKLLKDQYEQEFDNLENAISNEKTQQMTKMRQALLQRRIDKERRKKQVEQEKEEKRRREAVHRMNAGMAKVFREFVQKKQQDQQSELYTSQNANKEQLKAKLINWSSKVNYNQIQRGGEDIVVWNLTKKQDEIVHQETITKAQIEAQAQKGPTYDASELYLRILKVENLAAKVKDFASPEQMKVIMDEINQINQF